MNYPRSETKVIIGALRILVNDIQSDDGVANTCIAEAAMRLEELQERIKQLEEQLEWKPIDDYARSGAEILLAYKDCGVIGYDVCAYKEFRDSWDSEKEYRFETHSELYEILEDCVLGYKPITLFKEK